ncbi:uncharacterized protein SPSK_08163 [Sporothrix schenckii 1099-18]|uniref:Uncharacterized protein n=1 Tax=Sporothrix schenckii 1099-18 TaxID=1397361 RepID=A0A0F2MHK0_SPOSC|nr:uncharacterized protein SPSK_08163 [Sporothrix schenckii 1099-18]KJR87646.1 hypothetical protein SPSK_08163 [Sporothrix schenckii 1099-18]
MLISFAQRVVDEDGEDVTDEWAYLSNESLEEKLVKRAAKRALRSICHRQRRKSKVDSTTAAKLTKAETDTITIVDDDDSMMVGADDDFEPSFSDTSATTDGSIGI